MCNKQPILSLIALSCDGKCFAKIQLGATNDYEQVGQHHLQQSPAKKYQSKGVALSPLPKRVPFAIHAKDARVLRSDTRHSRQAPVVLKPFPNRRYSEGYYCELAYSYFSLIAFQHHVQHPTLSGGLSIIQQERIYFMYYNLDVANFGTAVSDCWRDTQQPLIS